MNLVANRAGYQYTINQDRLYSKNLEETESPVCKGIHLDSNWDYEWDKENWCKLPNFYPF